MSLECPECHGPLVDLVYGAETCDGNHVISDFKPITGRCFEPGALYGNWEDPEFSLFLVAEEDVPEKRRIWRSKQGCCLWRHKPEPDESNYCIECGDVMLIEPKVGGGS